jgi:hypothetical protein
MTTHTKHTKREQIGAAIGFGIFSLASAAAMVFGGGLANADASQFTVPVPHQPAPGTCETFYGGRAPIQGGHTGQGLLKLRVCTPPTNP